MKLRYDDGSVADETLEEETLHDLSPCAESSQEEQPAQCDQDAWSVEDVQLEFLDISCVPEQRDDNERKSEVSSQTGCANCLPVNQGPVIDAEERALLNLLKFDNRVPRGSRWNASGVSRRYVTLVEWPKRGDEEKDRQRYKKRARMERTSSMLERLQSCLNRAEMQKAAAAASVDSAKSLEGMLLFGAHNRVLFLEVAANHSEIKTFETTTVLHKRLSLTSLLVQFYGISRENLILRGEGRGVCLTKRL